MKMILKLQYLLIIFFLFLLSCQSTNQSTSNNKTITSRESNEQIKLEENKALVTKLYQALNDTNWNLARSFVSNDFRHHYVKDTGFGVLPWAGFEKGYRMSLTAFPDWKLSVINMVAEGNYVSVLLTGSGTHLAEFAGIAATKKRAGAPIMLLHQIENGRIVADWEIMNTGSFMNQLKTP